MSETVIIDANVMFDIGRGNAAAAEGLTNYLNNGTTVQISKAAYDELVTRNAVSGAGYDAVLKELKISVAPAGSMADRLNLHADNIEVKPGTGPTGGGPIKDYARNVTNPDGSKSPDTNKPGDAFVASQVKANNARLWTLDSKLRDRALALDVKIAPESYLPPTRTSVESPHTARKLLRQAPIVSGSRGGTPGRGESGKPLSTGTRGYDPESTQLKAMGGIMALGGLVGWLDDNAIEGAKNKDVTEWETYIRSRQTLDPETGYLLVAIIKRWQPRDAAYATRQYVGLEKAEGPSLAAAAAIARRNILPGLPVPTETVSYEYLQIWYPPLRPRVVISSADADEKRFGSQHWYPTFQRLRQSMDAPPDYGEALSVLVGSWLLVTLNVLDHLRSYSPRMYEDLKTQLRSLREPINRARIDVAFRAVEARLSDSSFGMDGFLRDYQTKEYYDQLPAQSQKEVSDWVDSAAGAMKHVMQGQWDVVMEDGQRFLYSFRLSGSVIYRNAGSGAIAGEGTWSTGDDGVRATWPKTGTVEHFSAPLKTEKQPVKSVTKWGGTFPMYARKINPNP